MKKYFSKLYAAAVALNHSNIMGLLDKNPEAVLLDLGCDDGIVTMKMAETIGTTNVHGVEVVEERIKQAEERGVKVKNFDLNHPFDYPDNFFDVVHSNQVIEHLLDTDNYLDEILRILKPGGYAVISTENASSWCNIFASIMGWQIFSLTNFSSKGWGIGNPIALHRGEDTTLKSWFHVRILNIRGLKEYFEAANFTIDGVRCAGYFPLPALIGNIDKTHGHFMTFKVRKPMGTESKSATFSQ